MLAIMDLDLASVFLVVTFLSLGLFYLLNGVQRTAYPRGPWGLPLVGHLPFLDTYPENTFKKWCRKYGPVFRIRMGSWDTIVLNGYDVIKAASEFEDDVFSDRINFTSFTIQKDLNDGIYTLTTNPFNETLLQGRKIATKAIGAMTRLRNPVFEDIVSTTVQSFCTAVMSKGKHAAINLQPDVDKAVGTIVYKVVYGRGHDDTRTEQQIQAITNVCQETLSVMSCGSPIDVLPWMKYFVPTKLESLANVWTMLQQIGLKEIKIHKQTFDEEQVADITDYVIDYEKKQTVHIGDKKDPVSLLLLNGLKEFFGAGFETSSTTLKWLFLYMIAYPHIQAKVQAEIDEVVGSARVVSLDDKDRLHYTAAVVNEVMRMTSIVPFAIPHRARRDAKFMGFDIDEGTYVVFNLHSINYESDYWGDPKVFRPERLLDENGHLDKQKCNRVVPFSLGRRRCVGERLARMQVFILFAALMQQCSLEKPDGDVIDMTPVPNLIYAPKPYKVVVKDR